MREPSEIELRWEEYRLAHAAELEAMSYWDRTVLRTKWLQQETVKMNVGVVVTGNLTDVAIAKGLRSFQMFEEKSLDRLRLQRLRLTDLKEWDE